MVRSHISQNLYQIEEKVPKILYSRRILSIFSPKNPVSWKPNVMKTKNPESLLLNSNPLILSTPFLRLSSAAASTPVEAGLGCLPRASPHPHPTAHTPAEEGQGLLRTAGPGELPQVRSRAQTPGRPVSALIR